jgi:hypothetical protein
MARVATLDTVERLTSFRQRGAGTDAERRAAGWLANELRLGGREVRVETFWCRPNWALAHVWHVTLALAGSLVSTSAPHVGIGLLTVALISTIADPLTGRSLGRRLTPERASQNVVAPPKHGYRPVRLLITANYDAGRTGLIYLRAARTAAATLRRALGPLALGWLGWLCVAIIGLMAVAAVRAAGHDSTALGIVQVPPSVALVLALALLLETAASPPGPAANDNASGTAVALALSRALDVAPPRHVAVELVLQGAGPDVGLRRYLSTRRGQVKPSDTVVLGIGPSGAGDLRWWRSDGSGLPGRYSPRLDDLCARVAAEQPQLHARPHRGRGTTPAGSARQRRLPAATIGCLDHSGLAPGSHGRARPHHPIRLDPRRRHRRLLRAPHGSHSAGRYTGVMGLRLAGHSRCLPAVAAKRRISSPRSASGSITASITSSEAKCRMSMSRPYSDRSSSVRAARSPSSAIAWSWL